LKSAFRHSEFFSQLNDLEDRSIGRAEVDGDGAPGDKASVSIHHCCGALRPTQIDSEYFTHWETFSLMFSLPQQRRSSNLSTLESKD
jgi:hypothetical protein